MYKIKREDLYIGGLVIFLAIVSLLIIRNFIIPLIFTGTLVYIFHPVYKKINSYIDNHFATSMASISIILLLIILPTILTFAQVSKEFSVLENPKITESFDKLSTSINEEYNLNVNLTAEYNSFLIQANNWLRDLLFRGLPEFVFNVFIIVFFFYYFLKNYEKESGYFKIFFNQKTLKRWGKKVRKLLNGIIYGQILVRLIQTAVGTALFFIVGVEGAVIWGVLMFFASFIPLLGTALIWVPIILLNIIQERYDIAIYVLAVGLIIGVLDNVLLPYFISEKTNIGPVITLISILGGLQLFGIYGIILGPFCLGLFFVTLDELLIQIKKANPDSKRYIWTKKEREKFKSLKTDQARTEFIRMMHTKYKKEEIGKSNKVKYRIIDPKAS